MTCISEDGKLARKRIQNFLMNVGMWRNDVISVTHPVNGVFVLDCSDLVTLLDEANPNPAESTICEDQP